VDWRQSKSGNSRKGLEFADDWQERTCDLGGFDMSAGAYDAELCESGV
jgi:hypothetical protein